MGFETKTIRIAMNGITGRMGYRQHLLRSILPIRDAGGFTLEDGTKVQVEPILVGRNEAEDPRARRAAQGLRVDHGPGRPSSTTPPSTSSSTPP